MTEDEARAQLQERFVLYLRAATAAGDGTGATISVIKAALATDNTQTASEALVAMGAKFFDAGAAAAFDMMTVAASQR